MPSHAEDLQKAFDLIDQANSGDPQVEDHQGKSAPKAVLYGQRMSQWLERVEPQASMALRLAARAQHIQRWSIPRETYPEGKKGYHQWRTALGRFHGEKAGEILAACGFGGDLIQRVAALLRKEGLKTDPETQTLEDVICLVFLQYELAEFARKHDREKLVDILRKTWGKMSARGQALALALEYPPELRAVLNSALSAKVE
ncbi:MAG: DUF4202 domain-containing protein [Deltaproteobacteria bacterium]|nr:DUF4202 domain-containing protein [Deltaproteobacteria bacterium]